jgi:hypothetical protein
VGLPVPHGKKERPFRGIEWEGGKREEVDPNSGTWCLTGQLRWLHCYIINM